MSTLHKLNVSSIQAVQLERNYTVLNVCEEVRQQLQTEKASIVHLINTKKKNLNYLVVDDEHRLLYCFVPKVASTNWLKFLVIFYFTLTVPLYSDTILIVLNCKNCADKSSGKGRFYFRHTSSP